MRGALIAARSRPSRTDRISKFHELSLGALQGAPKYCVSIGFLQRLRILGALRPKALVKFPRSRGLEISCGGSWRGP